MKQNKYDDLGFFENYNQLPRSIKGLEGAGEWGAFRSMFPELRDKRCLISAADSGGTAGT